MLLRDCLLRSEDQLVDLLSLELLLAFLRGDRFHQEALNLAFGVRRELCVRL